MSLTPLTMTNRAARTQYIVLCVFIIGATIRFMDIGILATYIDETIVLSEGAWNSAGRSDADLGSSSPFEFARKIMVNPQSSYAPGQFLLTYFFVNERQLSAQSLQGARLVSVLLSLISYVLLWRLLRSWRNAMDTLALPLALFWFSPLFILNSELAYCYVSAVFGTCILLTCLVRGVHARRPLVGFLWGGLAALSVSFQYQLVFVALSCVGAIAIETIPNLGARGFSRILPQASFALPLLLSSFGVVIFLGGKAPMGIPWWLSDFAKANRPLGAESYWIATHLFDIVANLFAPRGIALVGILAAALLAMGVAMPNSWRALASDKHRRLMCVVSVGVFFLCVVSYCTRRTALSPSRHSLILLVPSVILFAHALAALAQHLQKQARYMKVTIVAVTLLLTSAAVANAWMERDEKKETLDLVELLHIAEHEQTEAIITSYWDYDKVRLYSDPTSIGGARWLKNTRAVMSLNEVPTGITRFLLVGQSPQIFSALYNPEKNPNFKFRLVQSKTTSFAFEPSDQITYWRNQQFAWVVERR